MARVSVIVPIYKTELYLDRCITSVVGQSHKDLEIILVDDGSPDRCPEICDRWCQQDSRIHVIHQENKGLGMARNTGIEHASGDYICFVDSDDYIHPDTVKRAMKESEDARADITFYGFILENKQGKQCPVVPAPSLNRYIGLQIRSMFLPEFLGDDPRTGKSSGIPGSACTCLISAELIRRVDWRFVSEREILSEDIYSMMALCAHAERISVLNESLYCYCENMESTTHTYLPDRFERVKINYEKYLDLCRECGYSDEIRSRCASQFLNGTISAMKQEVQHHSDRSKRMMGLCGIVDDPLLQKILLETKENRTNLKKKILYWSIRHRCYGLCEVLLWLRNHSS